MKEVGIINHRHTQPATLLVAILALCSTLAGADELQKPEPGKPIEVFLLAGQSNAEGRANGDLLTPEDQARLLEAQKHIQLACNDEPVRPLNVSVPSEEIAEIYHLKHMFGPELSFGFTLSDAWPDRPILLIKYTVGGTSLYGCWNPDWSKDKAALMDEADEPRLYDDFVSYVRKVLSGYKPEEYRIRAMFWVQGESDSKVETAAAAYGDNLRRLVERVRADLAQPELPFLLLQVGEGKVVEGMRKTSNELTNVTLIPQSLDPASPNYFPKIPNGHYNEVGMKKVGDRFAKAFLNTYAKE